MVMTYIQTSGPKAVGRTDHTYWRTAAVVHVAMSFPVALSDWILRVYFVYFVPVISRHTEWISLIIC